MAIGVAVAAGLGCSSGDGAELGVDRQTVPPSTTAAPTTTSTTALSVFDLDVGTCFDEPALQQDDPVELQTLEEVDCDGPHDNEVYALLEHAGGQSEPYPGTEEVIRFADAECLDRFDGFVGRPYAESALDIVTVWPTESSWAEGDREVVCVVFRVDRQPMEGTAEGSGV